MGAIETHGLTKRFGDLVAVDSLDLDIAEGEIFGLLGPNGAGKTTTISMLATLLGLDGGSASVAGFDVVRQPAQVREQIGIVFQDPSSDDILTGAENLYLHGLMYGVPRAVIPGRIEEALELVQLKGREHDLVRTYSGGMRRRLELARGLLHHPRILFLDEPTLGLDPQTRQRIWTHIESIVAERKVTIILTTHYMEEADRLCDRLAIIDFGRIVALDSPRALKAVVGGDTVQLEVPAAAANDAAAALEALECVSRCEVRDGRLDVAVQEVAHNLPAVFAAAGEIASFSVRNTTLDDVFLHFTGHDIRDETAEDVAKHMSRVQLVSR
ncbi:MAG: ABC transporter ATP-binding protein [Marine Group III euryarchaeote CG-Bathy2]|uniref:ABC transporter ATP-binding protein (ABC-2.AB.A) n=2 Tax=Methanobacteriati TaxID=3366610 RepID=A0A075GV57_9EURY|nr:ABC transporter ATP-binding protein (ABC-2.AB.A) [uncultured marine group II/III euryarchaeote KM3_190_A12]OIR09394.1 MAG: ABC transporter ATP-binding protein [Marine Group III euryarchaeote CG-Bathy2]